MKKVFLVLIDFSPCSLSQVKLAEKWSKWMHADLLLVHHIDVFYPSLSDQQTRDQLTAFEKEKALDKLREFSVNNIDSTVLANYLVTEENLLLTVKDITAQQNVSLIFVGLKETGYLKRIFPGSTITKLADEVNTAIVAVPSEVPVTTPASLYVAINYQYPLNETEFDRLLRLLEDKAGKIVFLSIITDDEERQPCLVYLQALTHKFGTQKKASYEMYEGKEAFSELKTYMGNHTGGLLVLQRGARSLSDQLFRRFMINELVYDACIPLIILPA